MEAHIVLGGVAEVRDPLSVPSWLKSYLVGSVLFNPKYLQSSIRPTGRRYNLGSLDMFCCVPCDATLARLELPWARVELSGRVFNDFKQPLGMYVGLKGSLPHYA